jgi:hypothetical protein
MSDQATIYRTTKVLIDQHGDAAPIFAAVRADEHLTNGEMDDYRLWARISAAVDEISGRDARARIQDPLMLPPCR